MNASTDLIGALRSSPGPETGCSRGMVLYEDYRVWAVAILTRSGDRVQPATYWEAAPARRAVAILTRSGDRVQPVRLPHSASPAGVAILTRSGDRVQLAPSSPAARRAGRCDPHPVRRPGAATDW